MVNLRCCEIHEIKNDKIVESHILIDVMDLIFQTGVFPIHKSRGSEGNLVKSYKYRWGRIFLKKILKFQNLILIKD